MTAVWHDPLLTAAAAQSSGTAMPYQVEPSVSHPGNTGPDVVWGTLTTRDKCFPHHHSFEVAAERRLGSGEVEAGSIGLAVDKIVVVEEGSIHRPVAERISI